MVFRLHDNVHSYRKYNYTYYSWVQGYEGVEFPGIIAHRDDSGRRGVNETVAFSRFY